MLDAHCHIIWGVDDGSPDQETTLAMLQQAKAAGITAMHCTPHMRWDDFNMALVQERYAWVQAEAAKLGMRTTLGYEVYYRTLKDQGLQQAPRYVLQGTDRILIEFNSGSHVPSDFLRTVYKLQSEYGLEVTLAHPERYHDCQDDFKRVEEIRAAGVSLQVSAMDLQGGPFNKRAACAKRIIREGMCDQLVSDAHRPDHYSIFAKMARRYL